MIEIKEIKKYYGTKSLGLYKESAIINSGEIVGVFGENGAGKTTFLKCIMGLCRLNGGQVLIEGNPPNKMYDKMAFITEEGSYFPNMTPSEYGEFLGDFIPLFSHEKYNKLLNFFEISLHKKIKTFSMGQKSKLEVAAGFSKNVKYILMDEPFLGKDMFTRQDFLKLMATSLNGDETILISTHLIGELENFIDRAIIFRYGRIKADFYIDDIRNEGKNLSTIMMEVCGYDEEKYKVLF